MASYEARYSSTELIIDADAGAVSIGKFDSDGNRRRVEAGVLQVDEQVFNPRRPVVGEGCLQACTGGPTGLAVSAGSVAGENVCASASRAACVPLFGG